MKIVLTVILGIIIRAYAFPIDKNEHSIICNDYIELSITDSLNSTYYNFVNTILSDFQPNGYYFVINISTNGIVNKYAIRNWNLYSILKNKFNDNKIDYSKYVESILRHDDTLKINSEYHLKIDDDRIVENNEINLIAGLGEEEFLDHYFVKNKSYYILKKEVPNKLKPYLIEKLYIWKYLCRTDDETGTLLVVPFGEDLHYQKDINNFISPEN